MRQPTAALGVAVICVLVAGCGSTKGLAGSTATTRSMIPRPLVERELAELLLSPDGAAEAPDYVNSGFSAERDQSLNDGDNFTHYLKQAVVLFPLVEKAGAFFDASARQWPACHQYTHTHSGSQWSVGQIANANGALSTTATELNASAPGWGCGRALALKNNVIIDINTCSANPADSAVKIANQIAANVTARW